MSTEKGLVVIDESSVAEVFTESGIDKLITELDLAIGNEVFDVETEEGRKAMGSLAKKIGSSKSFVDGFGMAYSGELKAKIKPIDSVRKKFKDYCDKRRDEVLAPRAEWKAIRDAVDADIAAMSESTRPEFPLTSEQIKDKLQNVDVMAGRDIVEDKREEYDFAIFKTKKAFTGMLERVEKEEADAAELARLQQVEAERLQKEREDKLVADAKAESERLATEAAAKKEVEAQAAIDRAENDAKEAKRKAAEAAEKAAQDKIDAEKREAEAVRRAEEKAAQDRENEKRAELQKKQAEEAAQLAREQDKENRKKVNNEAVAAMVASCKGMTEDMAKAVVTAIAKKQINNVTINY